MLSLTVIGEEMQLVLSFVSMNEIFHDVTPCMQRYAPGISRVFVITRLSK